MKTVTKLSLLCVIISFTASVAFGQGRPSEGSVGLRASIQSNQTNLEVPIWLTESISLAPVFGLNHREDSFTSLNLGVAPRFYQDLGDNFASYIGARGILQRTSPEVGPEDTDFLLGATGGGEYFLDDHFSLGVEGQLNFLFNDNGNDAFTTGAAISGTYYF